MLEVSSKSFLTVKMVQKEREKKPYSSFVRIYQNLGSSFYTQGDGKMSSCALVAIVLQYRVFRFFHFQVKITSFTSMFVHSDFVKCRYTPIDFANIDIQSYSRNSSRLQVGINHCEKFLIVVSFRSLGCVSVSM